MVKYTYAAKYVYLYIWSNIQGVGKNRFTATQNSLFLYYLLISYCIFCMKNCKSTFQTLCIWLNR